MDKSLLAKLLAWCLITFGSFMTVVFFALLAEGFEGLAFWAWLFAEGGLLVGGMSILRNTNRRIKRLKQEKLERDILRLASRNQGRLTPDDVARHTPLSLDEAKQNLDKMQEAGHINLEVSAQGTIIYAFPTLLTHGKGGGEIL